MSRSTRYGLTLIEVLVVLAILGILISLLLPAVRRVREPAARTQCQNNLKELMVGMHSFQSIGRSFPPGCFGPGSTPEERLSWMVGLLPYLEQTPLYQQFDVQKGYASNLPPAQMSVFLFRCPAPEQTAMAEAVTNYIAMAGIGQGAAWQPADAVGNGFMGYDRLTSLATIQDGNSNTIALMETRFALGPWARGGPSNLRGFDPANVPLHGDNRPFGGHAGGMNAAIADGSVRFLSAAIDPQRLAAAITINGGEPVYWD